MRKGLFLGVGHTAFARKGILELPNFRDSSLYIPIPLMQNDRIQRGNTYKEGACLGVNHTPNRRGGAPAFPIFGSSPIYAYTL